MAGSYTRTDAAAVAVSHRDCRQSDGQASDAAPDSAAYTSPDACAEPKAYAYADAVANAQANPGAVGRADGGPDADALLETPGGV